MSAIRGIRTIIPWVLLSFTITTAATAQKCAALFKHLPAPKVDELADGQLLQFTNGAWKVIPTGATIGAPGEMLDLFYVVRDLPDQDSLTQEPRRGVLIFKTARQRKPGDNAAAHDVYLSRKSRHVRNFPCPLVKPFRARSVPSESYDAYHDEGRAVPEQNDLDAFHFKYAARRNGCRLTNDQNPDGWFDWRTNRGQFSFNKDVVGTQTFSQILATLGIGRAFASSANLQDQRVEVKQYKTISKSPVCVPFKIRVPGPASFLRINDLEGLSQYGNQLFRSPEREWELSQ